jgi:phage anti-repressor protein
MLAKYGTSAYAGCKEFNTLANQYLKDYILTIDMAK